MRINGRARCALLMIAGMMLLPGTTAAMPAFMMRFSRDPFSRAELKNQCATCHINPQGGGPRNEFGSAFEKNDHLVTPQFRAAWPSHFLQTISPEAIAAQGMQVKATFASNEEETIIEINGEYFRLRLKEAALEKITTEQAAQVMAAPVAAQAPAAEPKLPLRDQPTFDHFLVNLPTALPYDKGRLSMRFTHRFTQPVMSTESGCAGCAGVGELYGLDSFSFSSFGGEYGITKELAATVYRSPFDKTIEMGGVLQLLRQQGGEPLSAAVRVTVEGRNNFQDLYTTNLVFPVSRAIGNVAEIFVVPMHSFNANPGEISTSPFITEGEKRRNQTVIGVGGSFRFRQRSALVMEWMPRVAGFHARDSRNVLSFGILRSTNAHVFELVLSNSFATTTGRTAGFGLTGFSLGFNLYRRLR